MSSVSSGFLSEPGGRCPGRFFGAVQRAFQAAAGGILNIKAFLPLPLNTQGMLTWKEMQWHIQTRF